jgi:hypothetical protein
MKICLSAFLIKLLISALFLSLITICNNNVNKAEKNVTLTVKSAKIKTIQQENKINSYYWNNSLIVIDKDKNEIKRLNIHVIDSLYRIAQSQNETSLFIGLSSYGDAIFQFMGLIDLKSKNWIINERLDTKSDDWRNCVLPNPNYLGSTCDNKYHLFECGTGVIREFQIYDQNGKWAKKGSYIIGIKDDEFKWDDSNRLRYFERADSFPDSLPKPKEKFGYVQKKNWFEGKYSLTHDFLEIFFEGHS